MEEKILIKNDLGETIECDVLFTFDSDEFKKSYVVYTDNTLDDMGNLKIYANTYDPFNDNGLLGEVTNDEEWSTIEQIFSTINDKKDEQ